MVNCKGEIMISEIRIGIDEKGVGIDMSRVRDNPVLMGIVDKLIENEDNVKLYFE